MQDVLAELMAIWRAGGTAGLATVVRTEHSAPRLPGACLLVAPDGAVSGSLSGGCVEGAVYHSAAAVAHDGTARLERYGAATGDPFEVGLTCGGALDIFIEPISPATFPHLDQLAERLATDRAVTVATVIAHPDPARLGRRLVVTSDSIIGTLGSPRADAAAIDDARALLAVDCTAIREYGPEGQRPGSGMQVFLSSAAPRPRMLIFGSTDFAAALAQQGRLLGYQVTVCDARPVFATTARFPDAQEVVIDWPHRYLAEQVARGAIDARTVICVLTHDAEFDVPVLQIALRLDAVGYVGAMGSRPTHHERMVRLRAAGLTDGELAGLSSPLGLDIGARTPQETAVSIAADIIGRRYGGGGRPLTGLAGRIHHDHPVGDHPETSGTRP
ncbi:XshC-Cox1 family protein [Mycobacterium sp. E2462]|uniref:XdhC family protein n=1 Tax=Mycobacterium sp. E2462 TaxID=1834133 RepID=UPI0007FF80F8|nr:XdhC/CoxI family protein [Mycobacterium sp. E2462]OBI07139.1 XshC-Cox1 family protein [Mycobacterium sp. E2462]